MDCIINKKKHENSSKYLIYKVKKNPYRQINWNCSESIDCEGVYLNNYKAEDGGLVEFKRLN